MADELDRESSQAGSAPVEPEVTGGLFHSMLDIFIDPVKVVRRIAAGSSWWQPFIVLSVVSIALALINQPLTDKMIEAQYGTGDAEQLERMRSAMETWKYLGYVAVPILILVANLIIAGIAHLVNSIVSMRASFKKTLSLSMYCGFISVLSQIIGTVIVWMRGVESIESAADLRVSFGIAALMPDLKGFWYNVAESFSLFQIWYYILFVIGVSVIFSIERKKAVATGIAVWLVSLLLLFLQNLGGQMG
jgi:hypothetical protein